MLDGFVAKENRQSQTLIVAKENGQSQQRGMPLAPPHGIWKKTNQTTQAQSSPKLRPFLALPARNKTNSLRAWSAGDLRELSNLMGDRQTQRYDTGYDPKLLHHFSLVLVKKKKSTELPD